MENLKKLTEEIKSQMLEKLSSKDFADAVASTKAAEDTGTFKVAISTEDQDRQGEVVLLSAWDLTNYKNNPVVLWGHNYFDLPIGVTENIYVEGKQLIAEGRFASHAFAQDVRKLYEGGMLPATSVGFIAREMEGNVITKAELLEFSFVPVPANPAVRDLAKSLGIDMVAMVAKGIFSEEVKTLDTDAKPSEETKEDKAEIEEEKVDEPIVETPKPEEEKKGMVADMMHADHEMTQEEMEEKYTNIDKVFSAVRAFADVYMTPTQPVDSFSMHLKEMCDILMKVAENPDTPMDDMGEMEGKAFDAYLHTKSGRVLSAKNREIIQAALEGMGAAGTALKDLLESSQGDDTEERSMQVEVPELSAKEIEKISSSSKAVLRLIAHVTSEALANINKRNNK